MKWFKNTRTGLEWKVEDESEIKRLSGLSHFVEIDGPERVRSEFTCDICDKESTSQRGHTAHMRMAHGIGRDGEKIDISTYGASSKTIEEYEEELKNEAQEDGEE